MPLPKCRPLTAAVLACLAFHAYSAEPESQPVAGGETQEAQDIDRIVVTASRTGTALQDLPVSVSVVGEEDLQAQLVQNRNILGALESSVPGLSVSNTEDRGSCLSTLRGRTPSFQINGVPVNEDLRPGSCTGPFAISPFALERVEVVRGGTALYGAGAPGGIINLVTRRAAGSDLEIDATLQTSFNTSGTGDTRTTDAYAGIGRTRGAFDYYVGLAYTDGGRHRSATGRPLLSGEYQASNLIGAFGWSGMDGRELRLTASFYEEDVGRQFYPDGTVDEDGLANIVQVAQHPYLDQGRDRQQLLSLSYTQPELLGHQFNGSVFHQAQSIKQRDNFFSAASGDDFFASNRENSRLGLRTTLVRSYRLGDATLKTSYGIDYTRNRFYRFIVDPAAGEAIVGYITPDFFLDTSAAFVQTELDFGAFNLTAGLRHERYRGEITDRGYDPTLPRAATPGEFGESNLNLGNIGALYDFANGTQLYASFSQGAELTQLGRAARGALEPRLITPEPAPSDQYEIGVRGRTGSLRYGLAAYRSKSDSSSQIQPDPSCAGETFCPLIPLRVPQRHRGFEADLDWQLRDNLRLRSVLTVQRGEIFNEDLGGYVAYGTDVAVPLRLTVGTEWQPVAALGLSLQATHYGASSYYSPGEASTGLVDTDAVTLASGNIHYDFGAWRIYLAADNLFDKRYISPANQVQGLGGFTYSEAAGRRITVGVSARF